MFSEPNVIGSMDLSMILPVKYDDIANRNEEFKIYIW
jgi:hypothetical protein